MSLDVIKALDEKVKAMEEKTLDEAKIAELVEKRVAEYQKMGVNNNGSEDLDSAFGDVDF